MQSHLDHTHHHHDAENQTPPTPPTPQRSIRRRPLAALHNGSKTNPFIWLLAIICTIIAIAVIIAGIVVFIGYIVIHPRIPIISIANAHLDLLKNDYAGLLQTQLTILILAQNGNAKAHATYSDLKFDLGYQGQPIAVLQADPFDVPKNNSRILNFFVQSSSIPLTPDQMEEVDLSWKRNVIGFDLKGHARTRWRIGPLGSASYWVDLECKLKFHPVNGSYIYSRCSSKSK